MKYIIIIIFFLTAGKLSAQSYNPRITTPVYLIELITAEENMLKGLLLQVQDSSVSIYPGKPKEWSSHKLFKAVTFDYTHLKQISLQKKNSKKNGMLAGLGIGASLFAASFLFKDRNTRRAVACLTFPLVPIGGIIGIHLGSHKWKKFNINRNPDLFNAFKNNKP